MSSGKTWLGTVLLTGVGSTVADEVDALLVENELEQLSQDLSQEAMPSRSNKANPSPRPNVPCSKMQARSSS